MSAVRRRSALADARKAAGHTQEELAEALHVDRSTVVRWEAGEHEPLPYLRPKLARLLGRSTDQLQDAIENSRRHADLAGREDLEPACAWLDEHAGWSRGVARRRVADRLVKIDRELIAEAARRRAEVGRGEVAEAIWKYYGEKHGEVGQYQVEMGESGLLTSIVSSPEWLDLARELGPGTDSVTLKRAERHAPVDGDAAVRRLAEVAALGVRLSDMPIYRLLDVQPSAEAIAGTVAVSPFVEYALTMDLLEAELLDALSGQGGGMPLRDRYLPDVASVLDVGGRLCAGGALALCAIARPADPYRGPADYVLLVQERSDEVLNAARRLSVIPKGFHGPLTDRREDARIGATVRRELEEELFGRRDVDTTLGPQRVAAPMHPSRLSGPMRWLSEQPGRLRMECTGFGLNLVSGNYEFACLMIVDDDEFWPRFGGDIEANWEAAGLRPYSTLDGDQIAELAADEAWSNEGLFALAQGLLRLREIGGSRVAVPPVAWSLA